MNSPSRDYILGYKDILYSLILEKIGTRSNLDILDIGCKKGSDLLNISKRGSFKSYGIDIDFQKEWICRKHPQCTFIQSRAEALPFKDNSFDIIIISEVIEHISEPDKLLGEVFRLLKADGYFFITTPSRYNYPSIIGKLVPGRFKRTLRKLVYYGSCETSGIKEILADGTIIKEHVHEYLPGELKRLLESSGFKVGLIRQGLLHVPVCPLFDRLTFLLSFWRILDSAISTLPFSIYIKLNFIMVAQKQRLYDE